MNLQTRIKHINKGLTKYSRILFVLLSITGVLLSFFISNVSQFKFDKADTLTPSTVAGLSTNGVLKLATLKDGSERMVTYTNQWGSPYIQINSHYNAADYNQFNVCDTTLNPPSTQEAIATDINGNTYFINPTSNSLDYYPFNSCTLTSTALTISAETTHSIKYDEGTGNIYAVQDDRLLVFESGNYANPTEYSFINGRTNPVSLSINTSNSTLLVSFGSSYVQEFDINNSFNITEHNLHPAGINCAQKIFFNDPYTYISDSCTHSVYQYNNSFFLLNQYIFPDPIRDFTANSSYIYISSNYYVYKYNVNSPTAITSSGPVGYVDFDSVDLVGNDVMNLTGYYREVYRFTLGVVNNGPATCPVTTPEYVLNGTRCERWLHNNTDNSSDGMSATQSLIINGSIFVLNVAGDNTWELYSETSGFLVPPSGYLNPIRIRASNDNLGVYILIGDDQNNGGNPALLYYDIAADTFTPYYFTGAQQPPNDFVVDHLGNIFVLGHGNPNTNSYTIFPAGDLANPVDIVPDWDATLFRQAHIAVDQNNNIYVAAEYNLRIIDYSGGTYATSSYIDLTGKPIYITGDIFLKHNTNGGEDIYVAGSTPSTVKGTVHKFTNVQLNATYDNDQEFSIAYGQYSSQYMGSIWVDQYDNLFAVPISGTSKIAWFSPDGTLHDFNLTDVNGRTTYVTMDASNNLYITSQFIQYQRFDYDYQAATGGGGGGPLCNVDSPEYVYNMVRCQRYVLGLTGTGQLPTETYIESTIKSGQYLVLSGGTTGKFIESYYGYIDLPSQYQSPSDLYPAKNDSNIYVYFKAIDSNTGDYHILGLNVIYHGFDIDINTQSSNPNFDFVTNTNDDVLMLRQVDSTTTELIKYDHANSYNPVTIPLDFNFSCSVTGTNLQLSIDTPDNLYTTCGNSLRIIPAPTYATSTEIDLSNFNFDTSGGGTTKQLIVKQKFYNSVDIYVAGASSTFYGKVEKFDDVTTDGNYNSNAEYAIGYGQFNSYSIDNFWVDNYSNIVVVGNNADAQVGRFTQDGTLEIIDLPDSSQGNIVSVAVDTNPSVYQSQDESIFVTSQHLEFQRFDLQTLDANVGSNPSAISGTLDQSNIFAGHPVHVNGSVVGNPNPFPLVHATGNVEIRANGAAVGYVVLDANGNISGDFTVLTPGAYTISLFYPGDTIYNSTSLNIASLIVQAASGGAIASQVDLVSLTPNTYDQIAGVDKLIKFHVSDPNDNSVIMTGTVQFRMDICCSGGYNILDTATLDGNGDVTFNTNLMTSGAYRVYAYYEGNSTYSAASSFSFVIHIYSIGTRVTLTSSQNPVTNGNQFTLTAHVSYQNFVPDPGSPSQRVGWVVFMLSNGFELGRNQLDANANTSITVDTSSNPIAYLNLPSGVFHIRAYYRPDIDAMSYRLRTSTSETLFQSVVESGSGGGGSNTGSDIPPSGGQGGNSDFSATITGKDRVTGSTSQTKIGSLLDWVMNYNNLGPNSNQAITYFPIRENQDYVIGSVVAPVGWTISFSQDQGCDDSTFTYTPVGANGSTDTKVRCVKFLNSRVNVPPTRSDVRYITTSANFSELNVSALGGTDVYNVVPDLANNKLYYFNHHYGMAREFWPGGRSFFCFDLEINDTCVSKNPKTVYPVDIGMDGYDNVADEIITSETSFTPNAKIVNHKMYIPMTNVFFQDGSYGNGLLCWDLDTDYYCTGPSFKSGIVVLGTAAVGAWGWGNIGNVEYNPDLQEIYSVSVGQDGYIKLLCYSTALNTPCVGQPFDFGTIGGYDPGWGLVAYQHSTGRIYSSSGGNTGTLIRLIVCMDAASKTLCPDFPGTGTQVLPGKPDQAVFINPYNDQMCAFLYSDGYNSDNTPPALYCYDLNTHSFYNYLPDLANVFNADWTYVDLSTSVSNGKLYFKSKTNFTWAVYCYDLQTKTQCSGWEGGKSGSPFDYVIYTFSSGFGCMWGASDTGRVFTFDPITGGACNPLITLTAGNVAVKLDGNNMFCATNDSSITWNKVKVLDSGTSPSPALLNATVYDSSACTTDNNNVVSCTGSPLKSGNLLLNSGHEMDISDISYTAHKSLTAILEFQYSSVPTPAPGFYIELNPTNKAQMCASTKLLFSGALCANPITTVCENTNITYANDPVSNNNGGQACLNVETYFGKDPNSALCFVAATPQQRIFTVFNPNATVATGGTTPDFNPEQTYNKGPGNYSFGTGFFGFFQNLIQTTVPQAVNQETVRQVVGSITTQTPLAITAVTAVTTATVVATSVFAAGSGIGQVFGVLLGFLTPRKKKYWGIIFDDLTNKPVPFASITLSTKEIGTDNQMASKVITQSVSDLDGQYRLNTDKRDKFYLEVKASGYQPYTKFISMANPLNSAEDIVYDIPLRRLDAKTNFIKTILNYRQKGLIGFARTILLITSILGFIFTIYSQINFANNLNLILLVVYIVIFIISFYPSIYSRIQKRGKVLDVDLNAPIPGAVVRIYDTKQQIALSLTNSNGEARFDLPAGEYSILSSKRGYQMVTQEGKQLIKAVLKQEGYLDRNILMKRIEQAPSQDNSGLDNPFV